MTEKRFEVIPGDSDLKWDIRIADLHRVEKTKEDFWNDDEECYNSYDYFSYLYDNDAFLTVDEAYTLFNSLEEENQELKQVLSDLAEDHEVTVEDLILWSEELRK